MCDLATVRNRRLIQSLVVGAICASACGTDSAQPTAPTTPIHRALALTMSGALAGPYEVSEQDNDPTVCGGGLFDDPHGLSFVLHGVIRGVTDRDYSVVGLNFAVHRYTKPGTFAVGSFPDGAASQPAVASVAREITARNIVTWVSGSGSVVVDSGAGGGTLDLRLHSANGLADLGVAGTWKCPIT
jgi:hypothetical protein